MLTVNKHMPQGGGLAAVLVRRAATLELDWDMRQKSRFAATDSTGRELAVVLARGSVLRGGDVLVAEDGSLVAVRAAPQAVLRVTAATPLGLLRAAYHLGNRHIPVEVTPTHLHLENDPVLHDMLLRLGAQVALVDAPFEPEAGAYGGGHRHGHDASFAEDQALAQSVYALHDHGHAHGHSDGHSHDHSHGHEHGHDHSHDHDHDHDHKGCCGHGHGHPHG